MKVEDELRQLNNELVEEIEEWKFQYQVLREKCKSEVEMSKTKIAQLEGLVDELTERKEELEGAEEQNKLLRQLLKGVL